MDTKKKAKSLSMGYLAKTLAQSLKQEELNQSQLNNETAMLNKNLKKQTRHHDLRATFLKNYGVSMEFPVYYYVDAKLVPHIEDHIIEAAFHIIP